MPESAWKSLPLWQHQADALEFLKSYTESEADRGALVHMPTGTGKTGIISVLARCILEDENVLVLTPWQTLRKQMANDVEAEFWRVIGVDPAVWPKRVTEFRPSTIGEIVRTPPLVKSAYIGTIQGLQWLHARAQGGDGGYADDYEALRDSIGLVIVDEGHYEPAPTWSAAIRDLGVPTVLFTATPYRNDLKAFDISPENVFTYTYHDAVHERYIRKVEFREESFRSLVEFCEKLIDFYRNDFQLLSPSAVTNARMIVRCARADSVRSVTKYLVERLGEDAVGVHERFEHEEASYLLADVPDLRTTSHPIWVHQYKLMEGVDNSDFCLLAFYDAFNSARPFVQQVGRVLRNPSRANNQRAYVFAHPEALLSQSWHAFEDFEREVDVGGVSYLTDPDEPLFRRFLDAQEPVEYIGGGFRRRLDASELDDLDRELLFPTSVRVLRTKQGFEPEALKEAMVEEASSGTREAYLARHIDDQTFLVLWMNTWNSPLLRTRAFLTCELGFTICRVVGDVLFFGDSGAETPEYLTETTTPVEAETLKGLFGGHAESRLVDMSLTNTDVGTHSLRARKIRARDVGQTAPSVADHGYFVSTAIGYKGRDQQRPLRRYLGFTRGRVSEPSVRLLPTAAYITWLDGLKAELEGSPSGLPVFDRFAEFAGPPRRPQARNILLDVEDIKDRFARLGGDSGRISLDLDDVCLDLDDEGAAQGTTSDGSNFVLRVRYVQSADRFQLESTELADFVDTEKDESVITFLNREQSFRIIPESPSYIYAHRRWFKPRHPVTGTGSRSLDLLSLFHPIPELGEIASEKGDQCPDTNGWAPRSLFHLVDNLGAGSALEEWLANTRFLVCDDLNKEVADFIAAADSTMGPGWVAFIHAKAYSKEKRRSASAFAEVCSQAVKNLDYLQPYNDAYPPNYPRWNHAWRVKEIGRVERRIRLPDGASAKEAWRSINLNIRDPSASREVWLLLGQAFSAGDFEDRIRRGQPEPEDRQIAYLLQSTWNAVSGVGARLRIFCSP